MDYFASSINLVSKEIKVIESGNIVTKQLLFIPFISKITHLLCIFLYTLSASIFVSVFIINRLEQNRKEEHKKELERLRNSINIDVFDSLFKTLIPEEIFKVIKNGIIDNKIIRKNVQYIFDFKEIESGIELTETIKYETYNVGHHFVLNMITQLKVIHC